jgi:Cu-Zn family superoxide dismutase
VSGANGVAVYSRYDDELNLLGEHSILGRGVIIHAGEDDQRSQPTGNAGARVGYGVIGIAKH